MGGSGQATFSAHVRTNSLVYTCLGRFGKQPSGLQPRWSASCWRTA